MRIAGIETAVFHIERTFNVQRKIPLAGFHLHQRPQGNILESARRLHVNRPHGEFDLAGAVDVGVRRASHLAGRRPYPRTRRYSRPPDGRAARNRRRGKTGSVSGIPPAGRTPRRSPERAATACRRAQPGRRGCLPCCTVLFSSNVAPSERIAGLPAPDIHIGFRRPMDFKVTPLPYLPSASAPSGLIRFQIVIAGYVKPVLPRDHAPIHVDCDLVLAFCRNSDLAARMPRERVVLLLAERDSSQRYRGVAGRRYLDAQNGLLRIRIDPVVQATSLPGRCFPIGHPTCAAPYGNVRSSRATGRNSRQFRQRKGWCPHGTNRS